jgi:neutral amino acid transport system ATP-binding protein
MADRGYVLESGKDAISGPGRELLHDPKVGELYLGAGKRH